MVARRFTLGIGIVSLGCAILLIALYFANPFKILDTFNGTTFFCNAECYFKGMLDFVGAAAGVILVLAGFVILMERLFPREPL